MTLNATAVGGAVTTWERACLACLRLDDTPQRWVPARKPTMNATSGHAEPTHSRADKVMISAGQESGLIFIYLYFLILLQYSKIVQQ